MYAYIARQPIYDTEKNIKSYELFYRDGSNGNMSQFTDGDAATRCVLSAAMSVFGMSRLTNHQMAYIHFTRNLILNDFVRLAKPKEIAIEMMADITSDASVVRKLKELRQEGYTLVLNDYDGHGRYTPILPLMNIVRVNFRRFKREEQRQMARKLLKVPVTILAEKVETQADFEAAKDMGCLLFQGYFFDKPRLINMRLNKLTDSPYGRLLQEVLQPSVDFEACAQLIQSDASMTYLLLRRAGFLDHFGGNVMPDIQRMLVHTGQGELLRYALLLLARENNASVSDELIRQACQRGLFLEGLMENAGKNGSEGFLLGMFSLMDRILNSRMEQLVDGIDLNPGIRDTLTGSAENEYTPWLQYVLLYEMSNPNLILPDLPIQMDEKEINDLYLNCYTEADELVNDFGI